MAEIIKSRQNEKVKHLKKLGTDASYRRECGEFLCDGDKLFYEALKNNAQIKTVFVREGAEVDVPAGIQTFVATEDIISNISPQKTPQNVVFSCAMSERKYDITPGGKHLILENVQDPGNVGTIIRTANAFKMDSVILVGACADLYNPKTMRAAMGALFRQKVINAEYGQIEELKKSGLKICGTALSEKSRDIRGGEFSGAAFALGSEGKGLSEKMLSLCDELIIIPMNPECESLNVASAAAVVMWEMGKRDI